MEIHNENPRENESTPKSLGHWASVRDIALLLQSQWPKYIVDILVIILGITISFMLDSRKEETSRMASEQVYLRSLRGDIESDIHELDNNVIRSTKEIVERSNSLLALTDQPATAKVDVNQFTEDIRTIMGRPDFTSKDATFSDLRSSGNMQLITDVKLKTSLFEYYRLYESVRAVETSEREVSNTIIAPYVMRNFSIKSMVLHKKSILTRETDWRKILLETEFSNTVTIRLINRRELLEDYQRELNLARNIKAMLETQIN